MDKYSQILRDRKNTIILFFAQALYVIHSMTVITLGTLSGLILADNKALATLPLSLVVTTCMLFIIPASFFMRRYGRMLGFLIGSLTGIFSMVLAVTALYKGSFLLLCIATSFTGIYQAFTTYYRFAASDVARAEFKEKAISLVLAGGIVSSILGPFLIVNTRSLLEPLPYAGAFAMCMIIGLIAFLLLSRLDIPKLSERDLAFKGRPIKEIAKQKGFKTSIYCAMVSFSVMSYIMTATPLAMLGAGFNADDATYTVQWHVFAMFAPSLFTGNLIKKFGVKNISLLGFIIMLGCFILAIMNIEFINFLSALFLLGIGWNFSFVGASTYLTRFYEKSELNKVQAINDFCVFSSVSLGTFLSGFFYQTYGWTTLNLIAIPFILSAIILLIFLNFNQKR